MNTRLQQQQSAQSSHSQQSESRQVGSFENAEDALRADRNQTPVPNSLGDRIAESLANEPKPAAPKSWWQRLFGN